jgi:hypothetical protein
MSLWRKRKTSDTNCDTIAPNVHHNEQKPNDLVNILPNLSIQSDDLSIKREKAMREVQRIGQEIQGEERMIWVDPPEGWKFGFPAIYDPDTDGQLSDWVVRKGYPLLTIKEYGESWAVRCWPVEVKPSDESD